MAAGAKKFRLKLKQNVGNGQDRSVALKPYPITGDNFEVSERSRPFPTITLWVCGGHSNHRLTPNSYLYR